MSATKSFSAFKALLGKRMAGNGFLRQGDILMKRTPESVLVFELQKDVKNSNKDLVRFTVNVGISLNALRSFLKDDGAKTDISVEQCHWRSRLGRLIESPSDIWWKISDEEDANACCDEIYSLAVDVALPQIEVLASTDAFISLWQSDKGQGLTEYERRANLARLLAALGRKAEAHEALHALAVASEGKAWAAAAKVDAREICQVLE